MSSVLSEATVCGISTLKDGTVKVNFALQECGPDKIGQLFSLNNQHVKFFVSSDNITTELQSEIQAFELEHESKSPSKRMRNVFFRLWEQDKCGYEDFELFYRWRMDQIIEKLKDKLV